MELKQVANYQVGRYLSYNKKADKKELMTGQLFSSFSVDFMGAGKKEVIYYDTPDYFFAERGINIYITSDAYKRILTVKYDSEQVQRIDFLKNIPSYFQVLINKKDTINNYFNQIIDAINQVYPAGLSVNVEDMLKASSGKIKILKKYEQYRVVNNKGLKTTISFEDCTYLENGKRSKFSQSSLEVLAESVQSKDDFNEFLRHIVIECPKLIKIENNELTVARKGL